MSRCSSHVTNPTFFREQLENRVHSARFVARRLCACPSCVSVRCSGRTYPSSCRATPISPAAGQTSVPQKRRRMLVVRSKLLRKQSLRRQHARQMVRRPRPRARSGNVTAQNRLHDKSCVDRQSMTTVVASMADRALVLTQALVLHRMLQAVAAGSAVLCDFVGCVVLRSVSGQLVSSSSTRLEAMGVHG